MMKPKGMKDNILTTTENSFEIGLSIIKKENTSFYTSNQEVDTSVKWQTSDHVP